MAVNRAYGQYTSLVLQWQWDMVDRPDFMLHLVLVENHAATPRWPHLSSNGMGLGGSLLA